jgi:hypothetical protein
MNAPEQKDPHPIDGPNNIGVDIYFLDEDNTTKGEAPESFREWLRKKYGPPAPPPEDAANDRPPS